MANTYTLIASSTVGSGGAADIEFTSIPSTYTDLLLVCSTRGSSSQLIVLTYNSGTAIDWLELYGNGSGASSQNGSTFYIRTDANFYTANTFGNAQVYIPNYNSSNKKSISVDAVSETNASDSEVQLAAGLTSTTAAITSLRLRANTGVHDQYSSAYLYGISNS